MAITINNAPTRPALAFNRVHLDNLSITQHKRANDNDQPIYIVEIEYRLYGVAPDGSIEYEPKLRRVTIEDYLSEGLQKIQEENDPTFDAEFDDGY